MSKKKIKRKSQKIEVLKGLGFRMERHGRFIYTDTNRTADEHKEILSRLKEYHEKLPEIIKEKVIKLEELLSKYNTFEIIAHIFLKNTPTNPETYKEYSFEGKSAVLEYITLLCLKKPFSIGWEKLNPKIIEEIDKLANEIFSDTTWWHISYSANPDDTDIKPPNLLERLQFFERINELGIRSPAFSHHLTEVLNGLFNPFDEFMTQSIGFTVENAITLKDKANELILKKFREIYKQTKSDYTDFEEEIEHYKKTGLLSQEYVLPVEVLVHSKKYSSEELKEICNRLAKNFTMSVIGEIFSFTTEELAEYSLIDENTVTAFLNFFATDFSSVDCDFFMPSPTHILKTNPIIKHENRYLITGFHLLAWAIQPKLEQFFEQNDPDTWQKYIQHRHQFILNKSMELIKLIMPNSDFETNLYYPISEKGDEGEIDGIVYYDTALFLVEVKGGRFSDPARRGGPDRLKKQLKELVGKAHFQGTRAQRYISSKKKAEFIRRTDKSTYSLNRSQYKSIFLLSITMEPLGHLVSHLSVKSASEIFISGDQPWIVSLFDLMVIADFIEIPAMFPHYIRRRNMLIDKDILISFDELDIFGHYLLEGLFFSIPFSIPENYKIQLNTHTTQFDDYYLYKQSERKTPAPKPKQKMSQKFKILLDEIEKSRIENKVDMLMILLNLSFDTRDKIIQNISNAKRKFLGDHKIHNFTVVGDDKSWALTYICGASEEHIKNDILDYCERKKREFAVKEWFGIGDVGGGNYNFCDFVHLN